MDSGHVRVRSGDQAHEFDQRPRIGEIDGRIKSANFRYKPHNIMAEDEDEGLLVTISDIFLQSPWYSDIVCVLQHLSPPPGMSKSKGRSLKFKSAKYCILNSALYWKDPGGILLNFLVEDEAQQVMHDFHKGDCGGHLFWKKTANKVLRAG